MAENSKNTRIKLFNNSIHKVSTKIKNNSKIQKASEYLKGKDI